MNRAAAIAALLATTGVATAEPVTHPTLEPCKVTVVVAPPEVRAEIESWVNAEPRCERELEVRVVPTDEGYYLSATEPSGKVRERIVPDGQSAAVLVVSWMADDSLGPELATPSAAPGNEPPTPVERAGIAAPPADDDESPFAEPGITRHTRFHTLTSHRALMLGGIGSAEGHNFGVRGEVDLLGGPHWFLGVAGGLREHEGQARIVLGATRSVGKFSVRAQIGLGADLVGHHDGDTHNVMRTAATADMPLADGDRHGLMPRAEAAVLGTIAHDHTWGVVGGPVVEAPLDGHGSPELSVFIGVQHRL